MMCWLRQQMQKKIGALGLVVGTISSQRSPDADICKSYFYNYFWNRALPYIGMGALALYNCFLRTAITSIVEIERHGDLTSARISIVFKVIGILQTVREYV